MDMPEASLIAVEGDRPLIIKILRNAARGGVSWKKIKHLVIDLLTLGAGGKPTDLN